jgi:hypothetical protein
VNTRWLGLIVVTLVGCGDDGGSPPPVDASLPVDSSAATDAASSDAPIDGGNLPACTGAAYDPCNVGGDCDSGMCRTFQSAGLMLCTQACDASNPCPTQNGQPVSCNNMGVCRPQEENACTP